MPPHMDRRSVWKAIGSGLMRSRWGVLDCRKWLSPMSEPDAPTRCASSGTCAPLVLGDTPCMLALERWTKYHSIQCTFESGGWGGGGQWLWCTAPPRLAGCDHTFIAVPQAAHPCSIPGLCMCMVVCGLIRVTYFEPGLYSQVVLSWMEFHFT